jgi:predicted CopG family antitoxin
MAVVKRSFSLDPDVYEMLKHEVKRGGVSASTVVNEALRHHLHILRGLRTVDEWETEHGPFTQSEIAEADRVLDEAGVGRPVA